ncbi:aspartate aminotransferase family protein [Salipaludibacillus daqingensis]|uniref:aspartate aminotransferase family protein n=1 Tax=Salipaludibacillus daqingensis TaxID=3041001 RepID=UPI0024736340|nr:aspartate aminotransferase family protein [Salipaludibacillus daqingensis]
MSELTTTNKSTIMNTYLRLPLTLSKGKGSYVWDQNDHMYLDYTSGIATLNLGHVPPEVHAKVTEQLDKLWHCSNLFEIPAQQNLADELTSLSCFSQAFFCNSGAEANEAAIKLAKKYAKDQGNEERVEIVSFTGSFHGRTGTTLAATAQEKIHQGFTPITPGFRYLPFNDFESLEKINNGKTTAVILELVQGEGGVRPANLEWVQELANACQKEDILLIIDEVQTGMGRTGTLFSYEQYGIEPDMMTLAKGLGSGFPVGALLAKDKSALSFQPGTHGSTFGGNPLAMTAAKATLDTIVSHHLVDEVKRYSEKIFTKLHEWKKEFPAIVDVRGKGFLIGVEFDKEVKGIIEGLRKNHVLALVAGPNVLRILPPLNTTEEEIDQFLMILHDILDEQLKEESS